MSGRLWILTAALLWSSSGLFAKSPLFDNWPVESRGTMLAFWRAVFAGAVLLPLVRRPRWDWQLVPLGAAFTAMNASYLTAMTLTTAANAIWLQSTCPFWVFLLSLVFFRQVPHRRDLIPLGFAILGVGTILSFEVQGQALTGVGWGLASGVFFALVVIFLQRLHAEEAAWLVALNHVVAAISLAPWVLGTGIWPTGRQFAILAAFGMVQMALPYVCLLHGLRKVGSQEAVALGLLEPVVLPLWVVLVWGERPAVWTIVGAALILGGLVLRYAAPLRSPSSSVY